MTAANLLRFQMKVVKSVQKCKTLSVLLNPFGLKFAHKCYCLFFTSPSDIFTIRII